MTVRRLTFDATLDAARRAELTGALRTAFTGGVVAPPRAHHTIANPGGADGTLLMMPAWRTGERIGVKIVTAFPDNPRQGLPTIMGTYLLVSAETGEPEAFLDGPAVTLTRTAAVSALAADLLARPDAKTLLMVGTGALAPHLIEAHCAVRPYERVLVWGRDIDKVLILVGGLILGGQPAEPCDDLAAAVRRADVVSCATSSSTPLICGADVAPGTHVDLVGSFRPDMRESDDALIQRAGLVVVDTIQALQESGDLAGPLAAGAIQESGIRDLAHAIQNPPDRPEDTVTVFKSAGTALADLAVAEAIVDVS